MRGIEDSDIREHLMMLTHVLRTYHDLVMSEATTSTVFPFPNSAVSLLAHRLA